MRPTRLKTLIGAAAVTALIAGSMAAAPPAVADPIEFDLSTATLADINRALEAGALTSERLTELYLARIAEYDQQGPTLNAVITVNEDALEIARALDVEREERGPRGPLHGIPVLVKDVFDTHDMPTTGGFIGMAESIPPRDATVVERLRDAGAIILGKTNLSDWFGERPDSNPLAYSTIAGQVLNPYDLERVPGYSSAGTGAAMAAWFATLGLGSDTGGSVLIPTADSALAGLLPSVGLMSRAGMIGSSTSGERGGPMGRHVADVAAMLDVMVGFDGADLLTQRSLGELPDGSYTEFLDPDGLKGARIGILRDFFLEGPEHADGLALMETAIEQMKEARAVVIDPITTGIDVYAAVDDAAVSSFERAYYHEAYFARLGPDAPIRSLAEMVEKAPDTVSAGIRSSVDAEPIDRNPEYLARIENQRMLHRLFVEELLDRYELDALVFPYKTVIAPLVGEGRPAGSINRLASYAELPSLLVPAGFTSEGLPIAVQFLGRPFSEPTLFRLGYAYEQISQNRRSPETTPPLDGETFSFEYDLAAY
jgi:Asp-tRNA(Asn)/Glu-tRNA(Gln) amidotransferase A subunit family amidase